MAAGVALVVLIIFLLPYSAGVLTYLVGQEMSHVPEIGPAAQIYDPGHTVGPVIQVPTDKLPENVDVTVRVMVDVVGTNVLVTFVDVI